MVFEMFFALVSLGAATVLTVYAAAICIGIALLIIPELAAYGIWYLSVNHTDFSPALCIAASLCMWLVLALIRGMMLRQYH